MLTASASVRLRTALSGSTLREEGLEEEPLMRGSEGASQMGTQAGGESPQRRLYAEMEGGRAGQGMGPPVAAPPGGSRQKSPLAWLGDGKGGEGNGKDKRHGCWASLRGDMGSICLLLLLYTLQGVPMGLSGSIPFLLTDRGVSYKEQALFSLVSLPFSFKLLWAPLVDSTALPPFGRRKSWLVPVQTLCGLLMLCASPLIPHWMGETSTAPGSPLPVGTLPTPAGPLGGPSDLPGGPGAPDVRTLTSFFFLLYLLMATQDIAVDGWALTMLSPRHVGLASTCNSIGQALGYSLAHVGFLALHSAETCNRFLRATPKPYGMVTLAGFLWFWGWVFLLTTVFVLCKPEASTAEQRRRHVKGKSSDNTTPSQGQPGLVGEVEGAETGCLSVLSTYRQLASVLRLKCVQTMCLVLLTVKAPFAVMDSATNLKLIEYGMPKEELALLSPLLLLSGVLIPLLLSPYTSGPRPLDVFLRAFPARLLLALPYALLLPLCTQAYRVPGLAPLWFRLYLLLCVLLREIMSNAMFVAQMAFFARVSDPRLGGTYMTLLNTVSNLGGSWVKTASLGLLDYATVRQCKQPTSVAAAAIASSRVGGLLRASTSAVPLALVEEGSGRLLTCGEPAGVALCGAMGGACEIVLDGYGVQLGACCVLGLLWFAWMKRRIERLQDSRPEDWLVPVPNKRK